MDNFFIDLKDTLERTIEWSEAFRKGERNYKFDIDDELYLLSEKYHKDFSKGTLIYIYNLLDYYCDAIKHGFKKIDKNYSVSEANNDIKSIIAILSSNKSENFELPDDLGQKLGSTFNIDPTR